MKKLSILLFVVLICEAAAAQDQGFGVGAIIGQPTGLSLKNWVSQTTALEAAIAWSFEGDGFFYFQAAHLFHDYSLIKTTKGRLPFFYGIGGRVKVLSDRNGRRRDESDEDPRLGICIPIGLDYHFGGAPLDIFLEFIPIIDIIPGTDFDLNAAIGIRYFLL